MAACIGQIRWTDQSDNNLLRWDKVGGIVGYAKEGLIELDATERWSTETTPQFTKPGTKILKLKPTMELTNLQEIVWKKSLQLIIIPKKARRKAMKRIYGGI